MPEVCSKTEQKGLVSGVRTRPQTAAADRGQARAVASGCDTSQGAQVGLGAAQRRKKHPALRVWESGGGGRKL